MSWLTGVQDWLLHNAGEWWAYAITAILCWIDGFFPPFPAESIVISMTTMAFHGEGSVNLPLLVLVAALGAFAGDQTAYWIGRHIPLHRWFPGDRGQRVLARAQRMFDHRPAEVLLTARFIPIYRVAINMTAGSLGLNWRKYLLIDAVSVVVWVGFCLGIGSAAGAIFQGRPLLGIAAGVLLGLVLGWVVERLGAAWRNRHHRSAE